MSVAVGEKDGSVELESTREALLSETVFEFESVADGDAEAVADSDGLKDSVVDGLDDAVS